MPVNIRPVRADDRRVWADLWEGYLAFYETILPASVFDSTFQRLLDPSCPDLNGIVAEQDGTLIGLCHYIYHRHCWRAEDVCYLQDLFVDPAKRGTGAGRALIEAVYDAADAAGAPAVYWMTQDHNTSARQLYDRIGALTPFIKYQRPAA